MKNRDSNENIYRNLEKCYALLQVHILFSFHTLLYILLITHRKVRKIIGENQRISEKIRENRGKSENFRGKCTENRGISEESIPRSGRTEGRSCGRFRSFPVVFGRFSGHFRSFLVMIPIDSAKSFRFIPNDSFSFHFIPLSFHFHSSTPRFYALKHKKVIYFKISSIFFWRFQIFFVLLPSVIR